MNYSVTVAILNWNGVHFIRNFLPYIVKTSVLPNKRVEIVVIDNGSSDNSTKLLREHFPTVKTISLGNNFGFTGGYNRGIAQITTDYTVLLNFDVETTENWLQPLIELMESDLTIGACMPKIRDYRNRSQFEYAGASGGWIDKFGYAFCRGRILNTIEEDTGQYDTPQQIFWATGACCVVRTSLYKELGGLDELFFLHMEEIDLCWRMQIKGYKIMVQPKSVVYHVGGGALPTTNPKKTYYNFRNTLYMLYKNFTPKQRRTTLVARIFLDWVAAFFYLTSGKPRNFTAVFKAHFDFFTTYKRIQKNTSSKNKIYGLYHGNILKDYYILQKKHFSDLHHKKLNY